MKSRNKLILGALAAGAIMLLAYGGYYFWHIAHVAAAYKAKILCSSVFISKREPATVLREDLENFQQIGAEVVFEQQHVNASALLGLVRQRAIFRDGLGCTLVIGVSEDQLRGQALSPPHASQQVAEGLPWPRGDQEAEVEFPAGVDETKLTDTLDTAFSEPDPDRRRRTRAVVVVYDGRIIAERYAPGFSANTPLLGWSMTKSVINALIGILVRQGKLSIHEPAPVPEWSDPGDPRRAITLDQMLRMSSGLEFGETYDDLFSDVAVMLFRSSGAGRFAARKPHDTEPDQTWAYSSGTTNIIARIMRDAVGGNDADYLSFPRRALFDPIGIKSAVIEPDSSGHFVGSSFMYATARDWARFGLLYLQDGVWEGERILPEGWVAYSTQPTPKAPQGMYGAHFWLNAGAPSDPEDRHWPKVPADSFFAWGFEGQWVVIVPSRKVVIVRLGQTEELKAWDQETFLSGILQALPES